LIHVRIATVGLARRCVDDYTEALIIRIKS